MTLPFLFKFLKNIDFRNVKDASRRSLMETPHIAHFRFFSPKITEKKEKSAFNKTLVFLNELWICQNGTVRRSGQSIQNLYGNKLWMEAGN